MDYQKLLSKYIAHVTACQGVDFITMGKTRSSVAFTDEERQELDRLSETLEVEAVRARTGPPRAKA
jgi:hypothetical protein